MEKFYTGLHQPSDAKHFARACISINCLRKRQKSLSCPEVFVDSGAFTELNKHSEYRHTPQVYADSLKRLLDFVPIIAAVTQDYMCESFMLQKTGLSVKQHQVLTIERYDALMACNIGVPIIPVLQGYEPEQYLEHINMYGGRLEPAMWVGVGSICKRNASPQKIIDVLEPISKTRGDLRLHGFGVKKSSLSQPKIRDMLYSADSMAWSFAARYEGRNANSWLEAKQFEQDIIRLCGLAPTQ